MQVRYHGQVLLLYTLGQGNPYCGFTFSDDLKNIGYGSIMEWI